jgi:serine/threonine-protein phosphatase 2A activator
MGTEDGGTTPDPTGTQGRARITWREAPAFLADLLPPALQAAAPELAAYLGASFGNETRIDYGTGHELSFAVFLLCLFKLQLLSPTPAELAATVLAVFPAYIRTMRRLQEDYMLEPAGR